MEPPRAAITAATLRGILSTSRCTTASGIFFHSAWRRQVSSVTDVGRWGHPFSRRSNSSQRCSIGLRSGLCPGQSQSLDPIVTIPSHGGARNMTGGIVILKVTWVHPVKLPQCRKRMVIQNGAVGPGVQSTRNCDQGSRAIPGETPPQHNSTSAELHSWHNTFRQEAFPRQMPNPDPAIRPVQGDLDLLLQRTCFHCRRSVHHFSRAALLHLVIIGLWAAARP